jgi:hypothetical protein
MQLLQESNKPRLSLTFILHPQCLQHAYAPISPELNALDEHYAVLFAVNVFPSLWVSQYSDEQETTRN